MNRLVPFAAALLLTTAAPAIAHDIASPADPDIAPDFDITSAHATASDRAISFAMELVGTAGGTTPVPVGQLEGAPVDAYVWVTKLDSAAAGFAPTMGLLALAITAHPDFDDTPNYDENGDGDPANDGKTWHAHWVVLGEDEACGAGLKVLDVSPGQDVLPETAPGLPIALDSPDIRPVLDGSAARITANIEGGAETAFDAVTARLNVHEEGGTPLLCVTAVNDIASGDLSFPGIIMAE